MTATAQSPELVTRLRRIARGYDPTDFGVSMNLDEAADEIDRLTEEVKRLRAALSQITIDLCDGDETSAYAIARAALKETT